MYFELDNSTISKIEKHVDRFTEEMKPANEIYDFDSLYSYMEVKLESYSIKANDKVDPEIVDFVKDELEKNLTPSTLDATSGIDNLLSWIFSIEIAFIIVENEREKIESLSDEEYSVNVGKRGLMKAMNYLFGSLDKNMWDEIFAKLKIYIPQYKQTHESTGCMLVIVGITASALLFL